MRAILIALCLVACSPSSDEAADFDEAMFTEEDRELIRAFERCGSVDLSAFEGRYLTLSGPDGGEPMLFQIEENRIRLGGARFARVELCPYEVVRRHRAGLVAMAVHHEDIDDPGDAQIVYVRVRRAGDVVSVSYANDESELDTYRMRLRRTDHPPLGLDWRPRDAQTRIPRVAFTPGERTCPSQPSNGFEGSYTIDLDALGGGQPSFDREIERAQAGALSPVRVLAGAIHLDPFELTKLCLTTIEARDDRGLTALAQAPEDPSSAFRIQLSREGDRVGMRIAPAGAPIDQAVQFSLRAAPP